MKRLWSEAIDKFNRYIKVGFTHCKFSTSVHCEFVRVVDDLCIHVTKIRSQLDGIFASYNRYVSFVACEIASLNYIYPLTTELITTAYPIQEVLKTMYCASMSSSGLLILYLVFSNILVRLEYYRRLLYFRISYLTNYSKYLSKYAKTLESYEFKQMLNIINRIIGAHYVGSSLSRRGMFA